MFTTQNLYQNDPKWKDVPLGFASEKIGGWGCLLTSITMAINGAGYNETPDSVNQKMKAINGFQGAFIIPSMVSLVFPNLIYRGCQPCEKVPAPIADIDAALAAGKPVIAQVDWSPDSDIQTHFVLLKDKKGDDYVLYDPYMYKGDSPDKELLMMSRYKFQGNKAENAISGVLWWDAVGVVAKPPEKKKVALPAEKFLVYTGEDDLALRSEPATTGYLWKRMLAATELISVEEKAAATAKLGQQGKWLQVQDPAGDQGYVAAWYLTTDKTGKMPTAATTATTTTATTTSATTAATTTRPATAVTSTAPLPPGALTLIPTEEVAFRTKAVVAPETLIRRIPATEKVICVEPPKEAIAKIGIQGQWVKVRDSANKEGYVAAWYVKYEGGSTAAAAVATAPATGTAVKVKTTVESVAFRKQPIISDTTLIKRMPLATVLTLSEAGAENKIGANDQWLKVKETSGTEGYVAAWFVARA